MNAGYDIVLQIRHPRGRPPGRTGKRIERLVRVVGYAEAVAVFEIALAGALNGLDNAGRLERRARRVRS